MNMAFRIIAPLGLAAIASGLAGCPAPRDYIECVDDTSCGLAVGGECLVNADTGHRFCAYPDVECPTGFRWSDYDVEEPISGECVPAAAVDAGVDADAGTGDAGTGDAPTDAAAQVAFDVGFVSQWTIGGEPTSMTEYEWIRIVNRSSAPLDLAAGQVTNVAISDNRFVITAMWQTASTVLDPGKSAGALSTRAVPFVVSNGLVTEPAQNTVEGLLQFRVSTFPPSGAWFGVQVEITVQIGNARATLPVVVGNSGTNVNPAATQGMRVSSVPIP